MLSLFKFLSTLLWFKNSREVGKDAPTVIFTYRQISQVFQKQSHVSPLDYKPRTRKQRKGKS